MTERTLWAEVAHAALDEHARLIAAAKARKRRITDTIGKTIAVGTLDEERAAARAYFTSADWLIVAERAGVDHTDPDRIMRAIEAGLVRRSGRVLA